MNEENALHFDQNVNLFEYQINVWILGYIQKEGLTEQLMLLLCSIFGQIYTRGKCLSEHDTYVYYVRYSTNIKSRMKKLYCISIKIWIDLNIKWIYHYYQWDRIFDWIGYFVVLKQIGIKM